MKRTRQVGVLVAALVLACTDRPLGPVIPPDPVRTILYGLADVPGLYSVRADGAGEARVRVPAELDSMVLIGMSRDGGRLAFLADSGIYTYNPADTFSLVRTLERPSGQILPAALSDDDRFLAIITFGRQPLIIVADLETGVVDTLPTGVIDPVLPPAFSPDNALLAVFGANSFTLEVAMVQRESGIPLGTHPVGGTRFVDIPIFGWPRWTTQGLHLVVRRRPFSGNTGPDTLIAVTLDPADVTGGYRRRFRAISDLRFDVASTFAYSSDGNALVYGALKSDGQTHGIFFQSANTPAVQLVIDDPTNGEIFPQMVNGTLPVPFR
jgi:hypothetical protein